MFIPRTDVSPIEILKKIANSITTAIPTAAQGVSCGFIRSSDGSIKPRLPIISEKPISLTGKGSMSCVHGISSYSFSIGRNNFPAPVNKNTRAKKICAAQSAMCKTLDELWFFIIISFF
jgi:hypothetical protein